MVAGTSKPRQTTGIRGKRRESPRPDKTVAQTNYQKRAVQVEDLFTRAKRIVYEMLGRYETEIFSGDLAYDSKQAQQAKELVAAVERLGVMFMKIEDKAKAASDAMTTEERIEAVCNMIRDEGKFNQMKWLRALRELDFELSRPAEQEAPGEPEQ